MLNLVLVVPRCELHMHNGLETPWEDETEVAFHLVFGLCCNFRVKGIFGLSGKVPSIFKGCWNMALSHFLR